MLMIIMPNLMVNFIAISKFARSHALYQYERKVKVKYSQRMVSVCCPGSELFNSIVTGLYSPPVFF
jgi:hypothetical protein